MLKRAILLVACTVALAGCAPKRAQAPLSPCDVASGTATGFGRVATLQRAERQMRLQSPDVRGDLLSSGVRRVRVLGVRRTCEPYRLLGTSSALLTCKVQAQVCGRYNGR